MNTAPHEERNSVLTDYDHHENPCKHHEYSQSNCHVLDPFHGVRKTRQDRPEL